jgi:hypothetical protein
MDNVQIHIRVTEITDAVTFFVQVVNNPDHPRVTAGMAAFEVPPLDPDYSPEKTSIVAGLFSDGAWHRVRCDGKDPLSGEMRVFFLDYGNADLLPLANLRPLPAELSKIPGLSKPAVLAGLKAPTEGTEYADPAMDAFHAMVWDRELTARIEAHDMDRVMQLVVLSDEPDASTVNQQLLRSGWARVQSKPLRSLRKLCEEYMADEEDAKNNHLAQWEYGDVSSGDDDPLPGGRQRNDGRPPPRAASSAPKSAGSKAPAPGSKAPAAAAAAAPKAAPAAAPAKGKKG